MKRMIDDELLKDLISRIVALEAKVEDLEDRVEALEKEQEE